MEHLQVPHDAVAVDLEADRVPYVHYNPYDGGDFLTYPNRMDPPIPDLVARMRRISWDYERADPKPPQSFEELCQTWLYFGLLKQFFPWSNVYDTYLHEEHLNTETLSEDTQLWTKTFKERQYSLEEKLQCLRRLASCLQLVTDIIGNGGVTKLRERFPSSKRLLRVILALGSVFVTMILDQVEDSEGYMILLMEYPRITEWLLNFDGPEQELQMLRNGWCPSDIQRNESKFNSIESRYFISKIRWPDPESRHLNCKPESCASLTTIPGEYVIRHRSGGCQCEMISFTKAGKMAMSLALDSGTFPVVRIVAGPQFSDQLSIEVQSAMDVDFFAISHIWADGLGNPKTNSMPKCQLYWLHSMLKATRGVSTPFSKSTEFDLPEYFWIDTLCFPKSPEKAKKEALSKMRDVYATATSVLTLDASLENNKLADMSLEEACVRIFISPWMNRLWTFSEADSAKQLWFMFNDTALCLTDLFFLLRGQTRTIDRNLAVELQYMIFTLNTNFLAKKSNDEAQALEIVWKNMRHRQVSQVADEALCLGPILGVEMSNILAVPSDSRMKALWTAVSLTQGGIPKHIVFDQAAQRFEEKGWRWAPRTLLLSCEVKKLFMIPELEGLYTTGMPTPTGLRARFSALQIREAQPLLNFPPSVLKVQLRPHNESFMLSDLKGQWFTVTHSGPSSDFDMWGVFKEIQGHYHIILESGLGLHEEIGTAGLSADSHNPADGLNELLTKCHVRIRPILQPELLCWITAQKLAGAVLSSGFGKRLNQMAEDSTINPDMQQSFESFDHDFEECLNKLVDEYRHMPGVHEALGGRDDIYLGLLSMELLLGQHAIILSELPESTEWIID